MARITFMAGDEYAVKLSKLAEQSDRIAKKAIYEGVNIVADAIASNLNALPTESFRFLKDGEKFGGIPEESKADLLSSFGVTPISVDRDGNWNAKVGFDGYGRFKTKAYPNGLPNQLLARSIESGSSVRKKRPFVRPAVNKTKQRVIAKMDEVIQAEIEKLDL